MIIKFKNVGRNKKSWEVECKEATFDFLYNEVKKALLSDNIDFTEDGKIIVGGFRVVGEFEIKKGECH